MPKPKTTIGHTYEAIKQFDLFGSPLPQFNQGGKSAVTTGIGAIVSLIIMALVFLFGALKFRHLIERHNPNITTVVHHNGLEQDEEYDLS